MRRIVGFLVMGLVVCSGHVKSQNDSINWNERPLWRQFSIGFGWIEAVHGTPLPGKQVKDLPNGMNVFLANPKSGWSFNIMTPTLFFRDKVGIQFSFFEWSDYEMDNSAYIQYMAQQFPAYYMPAPANTSYGLFGFGINVMYRFHIKRWKLEPFFHYSKNGDVLPIASYTLHEAGSNHFMEYKIESSGKNLAMTGTGGNIVYRIGRVSKLMNIEAYAQARWRSGNVDEQYIITQKPYGKPDVITAVQVKLPFSDVSFRLGIRAFLSK